MEKKQTTLLWGGAVIILILLFTLIFTPNENGEAVIEEEINTIATTTEEKAGITIDEEGNATIEGGVVDVIDVEKTPKVTQPELNRPITIPEHYSKEAAQLMATKLADAIQAVKNNPETFENWLSLGNLRGQIGDYQGAVEIYSYLVKVGTDSSIPYTNLGNTYHYHLKDFPKAEENYLLAIQKESDNEIAYTELHTMYKNVYKTETTLAVDTLLSGLKKMPGNTNFMLLIATYYEEKGDAKNQLLYLNKAKDEAVRTNNTELLERINTEISGLE